MASSLTGWVRSTAVALAALLALPAGAAADAGSDPRIINGTAAANGRWPMQVSVQFSGSHGCGGTVLNSTYVLTAAHCFYTNGAYSGDPATTSVVVGSNNSQDGTGTRIQVSRIIAHENYSDSSKDNDIALLQLATATTQPPVTLTTTATDTAWMTSGTTATVIGWGNMSTTGSNYPALLQQVDVNIIANATCNAATSYNGSITSNMLCAGVAGGGKDSCQGDSGGPLFISNKAGGMVQTGVVSFGIGCARADYPGVYTRVANYQTWIRARVPDALFATTIQSGWYYAPAASGRGYGIEIRGSNLFMVGYLYANDGSAIWYLTNGAMASATSYTGTLSQFANGQVLNGPYRPATNIGSVGPVSLTFTSDTAATMTFGQETLQIQRFPIVTGGVEAGPGATMMETGWYLNSDESGRGYLIEAQGNTVFLGAFMYTAAGQATWYTDFTTATTNAAGAATLSGPLTACLNGQPLNGAYRAPSCSSGDSISVAFSNPFTATLTFPNGNQIALSRFRF